MDIKHVCFSASLIIQLDTKELDKKLLSLPTERGWSSDRDMEDYSEQSSEYYTVLFKGLGSLSFSKCIWKKCPLLTSAAFTVFDQEYSENSTVGKYVDNL